MEGKIQKWEAEIESIMERQKELTQRNNERIRELRKKIQEAKQAMRQKNNQMIADAVREVYGEVTGETLEAFKHRMQSFKEEEKREEGGQTPSLDFLAKV